MTTFNAKNFRLCIVHIQQGGRPGVKADKLLEKVKGWNWMEERLVNIPTPFGQIEGWLILAVVVSWVGLGWVGKAEVGVSPILWPTTPPQRWCWLVGRRRWKNINHQPSIRQCSNVNKEYGSLYFGGAVLLNIVQKAIDPPPLLWTLCCNLVDGFLKKCVNVNVDHWHSRLILPLYSLHSLIYTGTVSSMLFANAQRPKMCTWKEMNSERDPQLSKMGPHLVSSTESSPKSGCSSRSAVQHPTCHQTFPQGIHLVRVTSLPSAEEMGLWLGRGSLKPISCTCILKRA